MKFRSKAGEVTRNAVRIATYLGEKCHASITFSGKTPLEKRSKAAVKRPARKASSALRKDRIVPSNIREKGKEFSLPTFGGGKVTAKEAASFSGSFPS